MNKIIIEEYNYSKHKNKMIELAQSMRTIDRLECEAMENMTPMEAITSGVTSADYESYVVYYEAGSVLCAFGVSKKPILWGHCIWMLGSTALQEGYGVKKAFLKISSTLIEEWLFRYNQLFNYVHKDNKQSRRWLKIMGAEFYPHIAIQGLELFVIRR